MELRKDNINYYFSMQISVWIKKNWVKLYSVVVRFWTIESIKYYHSHSLIEVPHVLFTLFSWHTFANVYYHIFFGARICVQVEWKPGSKTKDIHKKSHANAHLPTVPFLYPVLGMLCCVHYQPCVKIRTCAWEERLCLAPLETNDDIRDSAEESSSFYFPLLLMWYSSPPF